MTDPGPPQPPPSVPSPSAGWTSAGPPLSTPVTADAPSTIAPHPAPRKRWIVVLVAVFVVMIGIAVAGTVLFFTNTYPPLEATQDFTDDLEDGDLAGAYAQMCDAYHDLFGEDHFEGFAADVLDGLINIEVDPFGVDRDGSNATVDFTAHKRGDRSVGYRALLVQRGGDWRVCLVA